MAGIDEREFVRRLTRFLGTNPALDGGFRIHEENGAVVSVGGFADGVGFYCIPRYGFAARALLWTKAGPVGRGVPLTPGEVVSALGSKHAGDEARVAVRALQGLLGGEAATRSASEILPEWQPEHALGLSGPHGDALLATIRNAGPTSHLRHKGERFDPLGWAGRFVPPRGPVPTEAHLRQLLATPGIPNVKAFEILASLPRDWIPRDGEAMTSFLRVASLFSGGRGSSASPREHARLPLLLGSYDFLRSSKGRWAEFAERLGPAIHEVHQRVKNVEDMILSFAREVVIPVLCRAGLADDGIRATRNSVPAAVAARILFGTKSLHAILEASEDWHRHDSARGFGLRAPLVSGSPWPVPFDVMEAPGGVTLRCLRSEEELIREGMAMRHCVGGYADRCAGGTSLILSVTNTATNTRLSTAELRVMPNGDGGREFMPEQNQAYANGTAPAVTLDALVWIAATLNSGAVRFSKEYLTHEWSMQRGNHGNVMDPRALALRLTWWEPHLPRPLRDRGALSRAVVAETRDTLKAHFLPGHGLRAGGGITHHDIHWQPVETPAGDTASRAMESAARILLRHRTPESRTRLSRLAGVAMLPAMPLAAIFLAVPAAQYVGPVAFVPGLALLAILPLGARVVTRTDVGKSWVRALWERRASAAIETAS